MRFNETRIIAPVLQIASKTFNLCMHLGVYESIWFKFSIIIATIELYI